MGPLEALAERVKGVHPLNRPFVSLSYAQSLDGSLAAEPGEALALSGSESARLTHELRAAHDAILVGIGTVLADDPQLTVRHVPGTSPRPIILDSRLRLPPDARLFQNPLPPWVVTVPGSDAHQAQRLRRAGAEIVEVSADSAGRPGLAALLEELWRRGVSRLMVEGGAKVIASFLAARRVDWALLTISPRFVGGVRVFDRPGEAASAPRLRFARWETLGGDGIVWGDME